MQSLLTHKNSLQLIFQLSRRFSGLMKNTNRFTVRWFAFPIEKKHGFLIIKAQFRLRDKRRFPIRFIVGEHLPETNRRYG